MSNEQLSSAASANGGFRVGALTPEEAERFAALFVPTWEAASEVPAGPDPGFQSAKIGLDVGAFMADPGVPSTTTPDAKRDAKKTMIGMVAADVPPPPAIEASAAPEAPAAPAKPSNPKATMIGLAAPAPQASADVPLKSTMVELAPAKAAPVPPTPLEIATTVDAPAAVVGPAPAPMFAPTPVLASSASSSFDDDVAVPRKRSPLPFVIGGVVVVALIGIFAATRGGGEKTPPKDEPKAIAEEKPLALPDPNLVSPGATAAATSTATATAGAATTAAPTETAAAKTAEPIKTAEPVMTAKPPPPAKTVAAPKPPPPAKTVAAPKPPPPAKTTAPKPPAAPKKPAVKEEF